jgi:hypothetical protein
VVTVGEIKKGVEKLPESHRKETIKDWFENDLLIKFNGRVLALDLPVILVWGKLVGAFEQKGRKLPALFGLSKSYLSCFMTARNLISPRFISIIFLRKSNRTAIAKPPG